MLARRQVGAVLADPSTPRELAERLALVDTVLDFAPEVGLGVDGQYRSYAEWPGDRIVTILVTTHPGEVDAAGFWFPVIGTMPYKGFFDAERAGREAARFEARGYDTCLLPVRAYSTLGWLADPLTGPMVRQEPAQLVETVLHELVHGTVFASSDADFNEGLATFFGQEAAVAFYAREGPEAARRQRRRVDEHRAITGVLQRFRARVAELYASGAPAAERAEARSALEARTRDELAALPLETRDATALAAQVRLGDACQALTGTYSADLPRYAALLADHGGSLSAFLAAAIEASRDDAPRTALLGPGS